MLFPMTFFNRGILLSFFTNVLYGDVYFAYYPRCPHITALLEDRTMSYYLNHYGSNERRIATWQELTHIKTFLSEFILNNPTSIDLFAAMERWIRIISTLYPKDILEEASDAYTIWQSRVEGYAFMVEHYDDLFYQQKNFIVAKYLVVFSMLTIVFVTKVIMIQKILMHMNVRIIWTRLAATFILAFEKLLLLVCAML